MAVRLGKSIIDDGRIGAPTLIHAAHCKPAVPDNYTSDMAIIDTAVPTGMPSAARAPGMAMPPAFYAIGLASRT